jgi:outer membrane protein OmpA-like peptidoglycan-associated protein
MVELMNDHPDLKISIEGHTDSDGEESANQLLSEERAITVMNTMETLGISPDRLSTKGFGESKPVDTNSSAEGKANNRRVEFVML